MSVNGVTESTSTYSNYSAKTTSNVKSDVAEKPAENAIDGVSAVYEASTPDKTGNATGNYKQNTELINKLKADSEAHVQQLQDIVNKLLTKQGQTYNAANGLKSLYESLVVDEATREQAKKDIAEDGYWGVEQTSSRIFDFAMALSGGDPDKMDKMKDAFLKGYESATKAWGDELPEISKNTREAVLKKFEDYKNQINGSESEEK